MIKHANIWRIIGCIAFAIILFGSTVPALAVTSVDSPLAPFELDGNIAQDDAARDDWENVNGGNAVGTGFISASGVNPDSTTNDDVSAGGKTKDIHPFGDWKLKEGSSPDKGDLANSYNAFYIVDGDLHFYWGYDRHDEGGNTTNGVWLLQNDIERSGSGNNITLTGEHANNDALIVIDFVTGGSSPTFTIFLWDESQQTIVDATSSISLNSGICDPNVGGNDICAISNDVALNGVDWISPNPPGTIEPLHWVEGGVNLTKLFGSIGESVPCFTDSFIETRASDSPNAILKDFIFQIEGNEPELCSCDVTKVCDGSGVVNPDGKSIDYTWTITVSNNGAGTLHDVHVTDSKTGLDVTIPQLGPTDPPVVYNVGTTTTAIQIENTVMTEAAFAPGETPSVVCSDSDTCNTPIQPGIMITKECNDIFGNDGVELVVEDGKVVVKVHVKGMITNNGQEALTNIVLTDTPALDTVAVKDSGGSIVGNLSSVILAPGDFLEYEGSYFPSTLTNNNPSLAVFSDTIEVTATGVLSGEILAVPANIDCNLCPLN